MSCRKIFTCARKLLAEPGTSSPCSGSATAADEFEDRAPYILAAAVSEMGDSDDEYRRSNRLAPRLPSCGILIQLDDDFPLSARFAHPAAYYLAAMLAADENPELSETLFDRFSDAMATIRASLPAIKGSTVNVYPEE